MMRLGIGMPLEGAIEVRSCRSPEQLSLVLNEIAVRAQSENLTATFYHGDGETIVYIKKAPKVRRFSMECQYGDWSMMDDPDGDYVRLEDYMTAIRSLPKPSKTSA